MHFKEKEAVKAISKEAIYQYILAFTGWWSIFWETVGSGGYILAGGGWWWVVVDVFWLVVGGVGGGGHILASGGWWWVVA